MVLFRPWLGAWFAARFDNGLLVVWCWFGRGCSWFACAFEVVCLWFLSWFLRWFLHGFVVGWVSGLVLGKGIAYGIYAEARKKEKEKEAKKS